MNALQIFITRTGAAISGSALFAIMALTLFDVSGRKALSSSIPGALELTEMLMVCVIFGALPIVSLRGDHVVFDSLDAKLSARTQVLQQRAVNLLCALVFAALAVLMWQTGAQFAASGETSAQLKIPRAPFIYGMSIFCALTALAHALLLHTKPREQSEVESAAL